MFPEIAIPSLPFIGSYGIKVKPLAALQEILLRGRLKVRQSRTGMKRQLRESGARIAIDLATDAL